MVTEDEKPANKPSKKERPESETTPTPAVSFEEFASRAELSAVRASGLQLHLRATTGLAPRPLHEWQAVMNHYQALA